MNLLFVSMFFFMVDYGLTDSCGRIYLHKSSVEEGTIAYIFYESSINYSTWYRLWYKSSDNNETLLLNSQTQKTSGRYYEREHQSVPNTWYLGITLAELSDAGDYTLHCSSPTFNEEYTTNTVTLTVNPKANTPMPIPTNTPLSKPVIKNTMDIDGCVGCIVATFSQTVTLMCEVYGDQSTVSMSLFIDGAVQIPTFTTVASPKSTVTGTIRYSPNLSHDGKPFTCVVKKQATLENLQTSVKIYVKRSASKPVIYHETLSEGEESDITCSTTGRPAPEIDFMYNETLYKSNVNTPTYNDVDQIYTVTSTFTRTFSRYDNGRELYCVTKGTTDHTFIPLNVLFPPLTVTVKATPKSSDDEANTTLDIQCTTGESNPVSTVSWTGKKDVPRRLVTSSKGTSADVANYHGSILSKTMEFNLSYNDIGRELSCEVKNPTFTEVKLSKSYTYDPEYRPFISVSAGPTISVVQGDSITIDCNVNSNPTGQISWYKKDTLIVGEKVLTNPSNLQLHITKMSISDAGNYSCVASNSIGDGQNMMVVLAISSQSDSSNDGSTDDSSSSNVGLIVAIMCVLLILLIIIIVVVVIRRRHNNKTDSGRAAYVAVGGDNQRNSDAVEEPLYNNIDESNTAKDEPPEYASVVPKAQRPQKQLSQIPYADEDPPPTCVSDNEGLVYAELDLEESRPTTSPKVQQTEPETEYISIDFTKTGKQNTDQ